MNRTGDFLFMKIRLAHSVINVFASTAVLLLAAPLLAQNNSPEETTAQLKNMSLQDLMSMDVTSVSKQPQPYSEAPAALNVITGDEIHDFGAYTFPEALRLADNLDVAQRTSSSWSISARGFNASVGDKLLVLIDGRTVYSPLFSGVIWNMQDYLMEDIDRIEVISGPGGTMWGANAVNGVINITSKSAADTQGLYLEAGGGSELEDFTGARYGGTLASNVYYRVYGKWFDMGSEVFDDGTSAHDSWYRAQGGFRIDDQASANNPVTVQGDFYTGGTGTVPGGEGTPYAYGTTSGGNIISRWTHNFADDADMTLQLYYDHTHLAAPFQSDAAFAAPAGVLIDDLDTYDLDYQDRFPLGSWNHVIWGAGYRFTHEDDVNEPLVAFIPAAFDRDLYSTFAQDEVNIADGVSLTGGTKVEHNGYTGFEIEPSVRLQWTITDKQMVWGAISRAVREPSRYDVNLFEPDPAYGTFLGSSNSSFISEKVIAYELGYRSQLTEKMSGSLSSFYNHYSDLRSLNYILGATPSLPVVWENNMAGNTYGFEASSDYQLLDWWRLHGGYDLLKENIFIKPGYTDLDGGLNETADPQQQVFLRSSMDLPYRTSLNAAFRWVDVVHNNDGPVAGRVPAYAELDLRLGWHATKNLEFSIVGQNLLHNRHPEAGFPNSSQEQIVRSVYGEVAWQF
jgi:iron complex outermembrane receptor protein